MRKFCAFWTGKSPTKSVTISGVDGMHSLDGDFSWSLKSDVINKGFPPRGIVHRMIVIGLSMDDVL